jgi:hypothetical protein
MYKTADPWTRDSKWQIVRADVDLEHVFALKTWITFEFVDGGFKVVPEGPARIGECFQNTFLRRMGSLQPTLDDVDGINTLANFGSLSALQCSNVMETLATHVDRSADLLHLEGVITIPCHETDAQLKAIPPAPRPPHAPLPVQTKICVYQIDDPEAEAPFLLIRAPFSPLCLANGNGSVVGQP